MALLPELPKENKLDVTLSFGKHKGKSLQWIGENFPLYLDWLADQEWVKSPLKESVEFACEKFSQEINDALDPEEILWDESDFDLD